MTTEPIALSDFQRATIKKNLAILDNVGAQYKIILPGGEEIGTLVVKPPARNRKYAFGETRSYYVPIIEAANLQPGQLVEIPFDRFDPIVLASNVPAYTYSLWGKGNTASHRNDAKGVLEVMRLG